MKLTFLGTGTSTGVPMIACTCDVCRSTDSKDKRLRASVLIEKNNTCIVVDTTPDFRTQMLRAGVTDLSAVLITHYHKDHLAGLDDLRAFVFAHNLPIPIYAQEDTQEIIMRDFPYARFCAPQKNNEADTDMPAIGLSLSLRNLKAGDTIQIGGIKVRAIPVMHDELPILGFVFDEQLVYITDAKYISEGVQQTIKNKECLVLNALRIQAHRAHFNLAEALAMQEKLRARTTYFTHISHYLGKASELMTQLPERVFLAYDGLVVHL